ncbi:MAG: sugar ABC transporter permease [Caldilineales bacterium]|nr:sugar ABC transporter permease [Caldilineales bacterium]MCW5859656.1 sugar ABC transporter permease [Caldilineales bacterium]
MPPPALTSTRPKPRRRFDLLPILLILPTVLILLAIQVYPAIYTVLLSFQERKPAGWEMVGLRNFERLVSSSAFRESIGHTIVFLVGYAGLTLFLGFVIALLLNRKSRLSGVYITLLFIPWILADIIVGVVFRLLVLPDYGLFSGILQNPALFPPNGLSVLTTDAARPWFGNFPFPPSPAMIYLILASAWRALPFVTLLLLAALQTVSNDVIESSRIDGANRWQTIRFITVPLILPTLVVALFSLTLSGMNGVGMIFSLTRGGPGTSTEVLSYLLYSIGWLRLDFGRAAALAMMIAVVNLLLISGTLRLTRVQERSA